MAGTTLVEYERRGNIALLTMNRPERMNALGHELVADLRAALGRFRDEEDAWVAVLAGRGRAFCTGGDLQDMDTLMKSAGNWVDSLEDVSALLDELEQTSKPIVAAVHGFCMGAGLVLAHGCALVVAGESTKFGIPETAIGVPNYSYFDIWKFVGARRALEMSLTAESFGAPYAREIGLINRVVPDDDVVDEAVKLASRMARNAPMAMAAAQKAIRFTLHHSREEWPEVAGQIWDGVLNSEDMKEGLAAFKEKRKPVWKNR